MPGIDDATFQKLTAEAKANCPVSKVLNADHHAGSDIAVGAGRVVRAGRSRNR